MTKPQSGWVKKVSVPEPSLQNNTADAERLIAALKPELKSETVSIESYRSLGNSSLGGATRFLVDSGHLEEIDRIRDSITYLELNVNQDFMNRFSAAKFLPHTNVDLFPSVIREML